MRLQKYLAHRGVASRRKAEEMIREGVVCVNGKTVTEMGFLVSDQDVVTVNGRDIPQQREEKKTYAFYKPQGVISSTKDTRGRTTVTDFFDGNERLYPVGRLDYLSEGLLLVSNDGDLALKLTHPRYEHSKLYEVHTDRPLLAEEIDRLQKGVVIDGYRTQPIEIETAGKKFYRITLFEGRNRQIRKMMDLLDVKVERLLRTEVAGVKLGKLKPGEWRELTKKELDQFDQPTE
ncbi:MAG TPA: rRNA pseudouridine synthase [Tissierellia bacterium]|jgi:23S rRNA pseudouridine2605 synthase|nr:rRNA pseudouridine synthase [Tissierellia bacterium]